MPTNSGPDADQDLPDDAAEEAAAVSENNEADAGEADAGEADAGPLQRSQDAIDQGQDAAREALKDTLPDGEDKAPAS